MIQYLNGVDTSYLGKSKKSHKGGIKNFSKKVKALDKKRQEQHRKIIEKQKLLARKAGAGVKRIAKIPTSLMFKKLLFALEHNVMQLSTRLKVEYQKSPAETKAFLSTLGNYSQIAAAINKGAKGAAIKGVIKKGDYQGQCKCRDGNWAKECCSQKSNIGEDETGADAGGGEAAKYEEYSKETVGIIQKIIAWFKKRKADKATDKAKVDAMAASVDADANIPKVDENGKPLPNDETSEDNSASEASMFSGKTGMILGVGLLGAAGYMVYKNR